jgi:4,5-DOPA dioxygenase extradiol
MHEPPDRTEKEDDERSLPWVGERAEARRFDLLRRDVLGLLAAAPVGLGSLAFAQACRSQEERVTQPTSAPLASTTTTGPLPVLFLAHGAPMVLDDPTWVGDWAAWARRLPAPRSILTVSAHWEARPISVGATRTVPLVYDFHGFPERYYQQKYAAPGAPELAQRVKGLLSTAGHEAVDAPERGLDHGAYVPLVAMYPEANVPVLQLSLPSLRPEELFEVGRALAPLRREGVLIMGSGFLTHNMRTAFQRGTPQWAQEFDQWAAEVLASNEVEALLDFERRAPAARTALPTTEHFAPVIVSAGSAQGGAAPTFPISGFWAAAGSFTRRSVQWG